MRLFLLALLTRLLAQGQPTAAVSFENEIRPLLQKYCLSCHSAAAPTGDVNLEYSVTLPVWQKAAEQLSIGEMPPKTMPQPAAAERARMLALVNGRLLAAGRANAGDPGPVVLRRLNNAEYTFTVRDLTGVATLDPAREFPADGAAGEGFMNTGNALSMSPSLVAKYLDAGKAIAGHAVLLPGGMRFSAGVSRSDWTNELLAEIRAFYAKFTEAGGADTVTQQGMALDKNRGGALPLRRYLLASLGTPAPGLSPKYLNTLTNALKSRQPSPVLDPLRARWRTGGAKSVDAMLGDIARWQNTLWKFSSVGHIGKEGGPKSWLEPVDPIAAQQEFRLKLAAPASGNEITVYLRAGDAGDGTANDAVLWREPRLAIPGRPPVLLRDLRGFVSELTARRARIFAATEAALNAAEEPAAPGGEAVNAWFDFLGARGGRSYQLSLLSKKIEKTGTYEFVQGWGSAQTPMLLANSSGQHARIPGNMKAHGVVVQPSAMLQAAVGWASPVAAALRVEGTVTRAHAECGNGITWALELRRGLTRLRLAGGDSRGAAPIPVGPFERVRVRPGDLLSILIGARDGNNSCDLTDVELRLSGAGESWSLTGDVAGNVLASNPHADSRGRGGVWFFYTEPAAGNSGDRLIPAGSLLTRWQLSEDAGERRRLAGELQRLMTSGVPPAADSSPDGALYRLLNSLASPLFGGATSIPATAVESSWGLPPAAFGEGGNISMRAPAVIAVRLPADLVAGSEFVTTGTLDPVKGAEGSVQLEVLTEKPAPLLGLQPAGTNIGDAKGTWSSNNQVVTYAMPVITAEGSAARKRVEAQFEEFRRIFPASLCYTKIVPVDEVVTLTLFHREDDHLIRLVLDDKQRAELDRLWAELRYVSRDALTLVDAFEQLWQFATQDADPSKFEPLRQPIQARAAAFRELLAASEPRHVDAVVAFAGRAYRRPLRAEERQQLRDLYGRLRQQELPHEDAIRLMLARVLVAPAFLYRSEPAAPGKKAAPVGDYELANRLSYFLWSSMPDAELLAAAANGALRTPVGLRAQTRRMLRDGRVRRLATEFGAAWLHIHGFDTLDEKSERHFPEFRALRADMYEEPIQVFTDLFANNRSVLSLLDARDTFLNETLAKYYGIPGVKGPEWRRVEGVRQYSRGGVLTQAAVLAKQSGASRTSPILRGNWILEVLLGEKLPRPPKDVPQLPVEVAAEMPTVRELTEKHTADPRCSGCHARIDPFGYTLERFDATGRYRVTEMGNRPVNDRATVKGGAELQGLEGLRGYLLTTGRDAFIRQFCRKLLGYALGRAVQLSDEPLLTEMRTSLAAAGYPAGSVVDMIVASPQFREIRGKEHEQEIE